VMTAEQIAARLDDRFRLLVGRRRTALPRQQTLRALIDWSWNLLGEGEKTLLRRLSVFSGGWTLEAAQQVTGDAKLEEFAIIDNLEALVEKSLVATGSLTDGGDRFYLLESIRQYARERLAEAGEVELLEDRHAAYFVGLIREAEAAHTQKEMLVWIRRLVRETDNFRATFNWLENRDPMLFLAATGKLMSLGGQGFWSFSPPQARRWLERAIEIGRTAGPFDPEHRENLGRALGTLGAIGNVLGPHEEGAAAGSEAVSMLRPLGEARTLAYTLGVYAINLILLGRLDEAYEAGEEARKIASSLGDWVSLSLALNALAMVALMSGDSEKSHEYIKEGKALIEELDSSWVGRRLMMIEGYLRANTGDLVGAEAIYRELDQRSKEAGEPEPSSLYRSELAHTLRRQGKWEQALPIYHETILFFRDMGHEPAVANQLECLAYIAIALEEPEKAARLLGAARAIRERTNSPINLPWEKEDYDQAMKQLAQILGRAGRDAALGEGRLLTLDEAVILARTVGEA
jgi:tetratricopeptide (TPR) repeat protein